MVESSDFIKEELNVVRRQVPDLEHTELITCVTALVRIHIQYTEHKQLAACFQFQDGYPTTQSILVELKSKYFSDKLLAGLTRICDEEAKKLTGKQMILPLVRLLCNFIEENPLCVCSEEIHSIKKSCITASDDIKLKQKTSQLVLKLRENHYFMSVKITIPHDYPKSIVSVECDSYNLPENLRLHFISQAQEIARQCIEPPLRRRPKDPPFKEKLQLRPIAEYLITKIIRQYPVTLCPICKHQALPADPKDVTNNPAHETFVFRVYCSHLFHHNCLETYMKTPPFEGGKKCPECNLRIFHQSFKIPPELAEARWAQKEARQRELDEVVDFLK